MEIQVSKENQTYLLDIVIPKGMLEQERNAIAEKIKPHAVVNGFRKGSAPLDLIKKQFMDTIMAEVSTKLLYDSLSKALKENNIKNASNPTVLENFRPNEKKKYVGILDLSGQLKFQISLDAPPEIDVQDYSGVKVSVETGTYEKWLESELLKQQNLFGEKIEVSRKSQKGDEVVVDFEGFLDDVPFEGGKDQNYTFILGNGQFVNGFEEAFYNREPNEEFETKILFPDNYPDELLKGKEAFFKCKLQSVYEVKPHELDDDLAIAMSYLSVNDMKEQYKKLWEKEFEKPIKSQIYNQIMDHIIEANKFDIPDSWVDQEVKLTIQRMNIQNPETNVELMKNIRDISERSVRVAFLLDKIYEKEESIRITAEELSEFIFKESSNQGMTSEDLVSRLKSSGQYEAFVSYLEQQKAIDFLIENASFSN